MLVSLAQTQMFILVVTRVLAILVQVPVFGGQMIPNQVKIGFGIILAAIAIPWQPIPPDTPGLPLLAFAIYMLQELIIGTLVGFAATITFGAFQVASKVLDISSGFGAGQIFNPTLGDTGSALDQFFMMVVMLYFLITNGHHVFLIALQRTFTLLPVMATMPDLSAEPLLKLSAAMIASGVQMALPILGALLLTDITLGVLAKAAPQMHVFFLGLPLKVWVGLMGLAFAMGVLFPVIGQIFSNLGNRMIEILGA